ncbi:MAG: hypothetical protein IT260_22215 [Saprospiraceae bacterium]|nr:hypothetical protein [Saprospiraceae bacterium]
MKPIARSKSQLARDLGLSESTLRRRLKDLDFVRTGRLLSPKEQVRIRQALGFPPPDWAMPWPANAEEDG